MAWKKFKLGKDKSIQWISVDDFQKLSQTIKFLIIDVSDIDEYLESHIPHAIHIDEYNFTRATNDCDKQKPILIYCPNGPKSKTIARRFAHQGFTEIYCLEGGFNAWREIQAV